MKRGTSGIVGSGSSIQAFHRRRWWTIPGVVEHLRRSFRLCVYSPTIALRSIMGLENGNVFDVMPTSIPPCGPNPYQRNTQKTRKYIFFSRPSAPFVDPALLLNEIHRSHEIIFFRALPRLSLIQSFSSTKHTEITKIYFFRALPRLSLIIVFVHFLALSLTPKRWRWWNCHNNVTENYPPKFFILSKAAYLCRRLTKNKQLTLSKAFIPIHRI